MVAGIFTNICHKITQLSRSLYTSTMVRIWAAKSLKIFCKSPPLWAPRGHDPPVRISFLVVAVASGLMCTLAGNWADTGPKCEGKDRFLDEIGKIQFRDLKLVVWVWLVLHILEASESGNWIWITRARTVWPTNIWICPWQSNRATECDHLG